MSRFRVLFDKETHSYQFADGKKRTPVISVTQAIEASGLVKGKQYFTDEHRERGSFVHASIAAYFDEPKDWPYHVPIEYRGYVESFIRWSTTINFKPIYREKVVYSRAFNYVGRLDLFGSILQIGSPMLLDVKTGAPQPSVQCQLSAYWNALSEMTDYRRYHYSKANMFSLQLDKHGKMPKQRHWQYDFQGFVDCLRKANAKA